MDIIPTVKDKLSTQLTQRQQALKEKKDKLETLKKTRVGVFASTTQHDPLTIQQALASAQAQNWKQAIENELNTLKEYGTFLKVNEQEIPKDTKILSTKYVFKTKRNDGIIVKHKARLVVSGHKQIPGLHFDPLMIYSPVVSIQAGRLILSHAASKGWFIRHSDVQSAFVQAPLSDDYLNPAMKFRLVTNY